MQNQKFTGCEKSVEKAEQDAVFFFVVVVLNSSESRAWGKHEPDQILVGKKTQENFRMGAGNHHLLFLLLGFRAEDLLDGAEPLALLPHGSTPRSSEQSPWLGTWRGGLNKSRTRPPISICQAHDETTGVNFIGRRNARPNLGAEAKGRGGRAG